LPHPGQLSAGRAVLRVADVEALLRWSSRHRHPERTASAVSPTTPPGRVVSVSVQDFCKRTRLSDVTDPMD